MLALSCRILRIGSETRHIVAKKNRFLNERSSSFYKRLRVGIVTFRNIGGSVVLTMRIERQ